MSKMENKNKELELRGIQLEQEELGLNANKKLLSLDVEYHEAREEIQTQYDSDIGLLEDKAELIMKRYAAADPAVEPNIKTPPVEQNTGDSKEV